MDKNEESPQADSQAHPLIALINGAIGESAHQKAVDILSEHLGQDNPAVVGEDWYEVAGQLTEKIPCKVQNAATFLCCYESLMHCVLEDHPDALIYAFEVGHTSSYVALEADIPSSVDDFIHRDQRRQQGASEGGKSRRALTEDQEKLALELISEKKTRGISKTSACKRAAATLKKDHKINVSHDTLLRLLRNKM